MIALAFPWALLLLPLPLLVWRFAPPHRERVPALCFPFLRRIMETAGAEPGSGLIVIRRSRLLMIAAILVWALIVLAAARPERIGEPVEVTRAARDVILSIDISGSMDAKDFKMPDGEKRQRLAAVRDVITEFVATREGDRVALIVFGSKAYVQAPLTEDLRTITDLLAQTEVGMAGPHTALGDAIGLAIRTFESSDIEQRLLILLSDSADTASRMNVVNAAEIARGEGVEIYTIGVGDPDASGEDRVDISALEDIAKRTGGEYFYAADQAALEGVYSRARPAAQLRLSESAGGGGDAALGRPGLDARLAGAGVRSPLVPAWLNHALGARVFHWRGGRAAGRRAGRRRRRRRHRLVPDAGSAGPSRL
ncbi:VWA domain-containing protein [Pikeienuella piscinae]|uniref:VWA domain-containing protein n=1 Tax=Pikeienuella piscinae TaxID=2748098 RepID=A0A7L5BWN4_9RHOB|nr:VWA domain-containing protein [Pikeienuella piscinae]QIE55553.1 VWA domain-containing protein [Pikeienuella piscinae]